MDMVKSGDAAGHMPATEKWSPTPYFVIWVVLSGLFLLITECFVLMTVAFVAVWAAGLGVDLGLDELQLYLDALKDYQYLAIAIVPFFLASLFWFCRKRKKGDGVTFSQSILSILMCALCLLMFWMVVTFAAASLSCGLMHIMIAGILFCSPGFLVWVDSCKKGDQKRLENSAMFSLAVIALCMAIMVPLCDKLA